MTEEPEAGRPRDLRCSDADRERVAEALRDAAAEGRLTLSELEERLDATFRARTYRDLEPITHDLPEEIQLPGRPPARPAAVVRRGADGSVPAVRTARITAVFGDEKRSGRWEVPRTLEITSVLGDVTIDFTEAIVRHREIVVQVAVVLGSVTLIVPEGIDVRMNTTSSILADRRHRLTAPVTPGGPVYWVRGFVVLGEITVRPPRQRWSIFGRR